MMIPTAASATGGVSMSFSILHNLTSGVRGWLTLADYDNDKDEATLGVIKRFARRNILFQRGSILDDEALRKLSAAGDNAVAQLNKLPDPK